MRAEPAGRTMKRGTLPVLGVLLSAVLFMVAAGRYPGGYDWQYQSISSLFQPDARNGAPNTAQPIAALAVVVFCASMAIVFNTIAKSGPSRYHRKAVQIGGIGAMIYAALVVTPMHDVLIGVALLFFVTAILTIFHRLYLERRVGLLGAGLTCLALTLTAAIMWYGQLLYEFMPMVQKLSWASWILWLFWLLFREAESAVRVGKA